MPQDMEKKPQERGERRERGPRRDRRPESEFQEKMVAINRVTKVVKGGRNFRFAALVVIGDGKGRVGCGIGKATEIPEAARKATEDAKKHLVHVSMKGTSIPHETVGRFGTGEIVLLPAPEGTGVIAGGPARAVLELCGVKDIRTKSYGSNNPINMVKATIEGLASCAAPKKWRRCAARPSKSCSADKEEETYEIAGNACEVSCLQQAQPHQNCEGSGPAQDPLHQGV